MRNKLVWGIFFTVTALLFGYILFFTKLEPGGDIAEYFGITESILNHQSLELTTQDEQNLSKLLHPEYYADPQYYLTGKNDKRYPVHFFLYSLLAIPVRVVLNFLQLDLIKTLAVTNLIILTVSSFWILRKFLTTSFQKEVFLWLFYLSPILSFIIWPGPDLFYICLLLLSVFYFYEKKYFQTVVLTAIASWQSQPLVIIALAALGNYFLSETVKTTDEEKYLQITWKVIITSILLFLFIFIPYFYNFAVFGVFTPWTIIKNGWTQLNGFGLQNMSLKKLFEQFFDLNSGLFWYMPVIFFAASNFLLKSIRDKKQEGNKDLFIYLIILITAFFYQTNPAWHYGTAGFGPSRHIIFVLPFIIYIIVRNLKSTFSHLIILILIIASQIVTLSLNGFLTPNLLNSLSHNPYATFVLNKFPGIYNPTPEVFVDRTNHTDLDYITTAIYKQDGVCKKAYVLKTDSDYLQQECGYIPEKYQEQLVDRFLLKTNFSRSVWTQEATFWPDPESCADYFSQSSEKPYICMRTIDEVMKYTGISDINRIATLPDYPFPGIWKLQAGLPVKINVPPGYIINHYSFEGIYVNY